jgi:hypothetical protein
LFASLKWDQGYEEHKQQMTLMSEHCITFSFGLMAKVILHFMMVKENPHLVEVAFKMYKICDKIL